MHQYSQVALTKVHAAYVDVSLVSCSGMHTLLFTPFREPVPVASRVLDPVVCGIQPCGAAGCLCTWSEQNGYGQGADTWVFDCALGRQLAPG